MSKATIVSIMPWPFEREMTGHNPAWYMIPASEDGKPICLVAEDATSWLYVTDGKSVMRRHLAYDEVKELVDTYLEAVMYRDLDAQPGIAYLEGAFTPESPEIKALVPILQEKQDNYFKILLKKADDSWTKFHQHRDITDPMRKAASILGVTREWNIKIDPSRNYSDCPACKTSIRADASVCPNCKLILKENSDFTFAS